MNLVSTSKDVKNLCDKLSKDKFICIDTEFVRETFYFPKLCLLQIGDSIGNGWAIDALVNNIDLSPMYSLLLDTKILKVFHAPRQDLEIFYKLIGKIPNPIFDTQSAGMACGFGDSVSYEVLVRNLLGIKIDKSFRYRDWSLRPLKKKHLEYAIGDVTYLSKIYRFLSKQIVKKKRSNWIKEEVEKFYNTDLYLTDPYSAWKKVKIKNSNLKSLSILREVAALREQVAQKNNTQKNMILKDEVLVKIAFNAPKSLSNLKKIRGLPHSKLTNHMKSSIIESVNKGTNNNNTSWVPKKNNSPPNVSKLIIKILNILLKITAEKYNISEKLIGNRRDLEKIASGINDTKVLKGWRYDIFGKTALYFVSGNIAISSSKNKIVLKKL